jgi:flagellar assembly protein FliH
MRMETFAHGVHNNRESGNSPFPGKGGGNDELEQAFEAGYKAGIKAAATRLDTERLADKSLLRALERELARLGDDIATDLLQLATDIAEQVTRTQITLHPENILGVVREALRLLRDDRTAIRIALHPDDAALVEKNLGNELQQHHCRTFADPGLTRGDCRIESGQCEVDATLAARWRRALQPLGIDRDWIS